MAGIVGLLARTALVLAVLPIAGVVARAITDAGHIFVGFGHDSSSPSVMGHIHAGSPAASLLPASHGPSAGASHPPAYDRCGSG